MGFGGKRGLVGRCRMLVGEDGVGDWVAERGGEKTGKRPGGEALSK